jgi:hypothetical protein
MHLAVGVCIRIARKKSMRGSPSDEHPETLKLRATETGTNVILLEPFDRVAFERTWKRDGVICDHFQL